MHECDDRFILARSETARTRAICAAVAVTPGVAATSACHTRTTRHDR